MSSSGLPVHNLRKRLLFYLLNLIGLVGLVSYFTGFYSGGMFFGGLVAVIDLVILLMRGSKSESNKVSKAKRYTLLIILTVIAFFAVLTILAFVASG